MSGTPGNLSCGQPFAIGAVIVKALKDAFASSGATVLDNPLRASALDDGQRIVFFEDQSDKPREKRLKRTYAFSIGVINRTEVARQGAHADYSEAKRAVAACMPALNAAGITADGTGIVEGEVRFRLENIDVGGGLVLGLFTFDYRDPS